MQNTLEIGDTKAKPGTIEKGSLGGVEIGDGLVAKVPVINVNGIEDGPVLTVTTAVHGTEVSTLGALWDAIKQIDLNALKGALVAIPAANPISTRLGAYTTPIDNVNLSGPWYMPTVEQQNASATQRLAYYINGALEIADYVIDMHSNPLPSIQFVLTDYEMCKDEKTRNGVKKIAQGYGTTIVNWPRTKATSIRDICASHGKPSITAELAGNYLWEEIYKIGSRGILNVMKSINMLEGNPEKQNVDIINGELVFYGWLFAKRGGFLLAKNKPGEKIEKGETVIEIVDAYGDLVQNVTMPTTGYCWSFTGGLNGSHSIPEGTKLGYVFTEKKGVKETKYIERPA